MFGKIIRAYRRFSSLSEKLTLIQESLGRIELRQTAGEGLNSAEFRVFSQWGEDGIIQKLIQEVPIQRPIFVEFGVEDYLQSNTRFLLTNNKWSGLVMDGSKSNIEIIKRDSIYWAANLRAECAFIDKDNINELLLSNGVSGDIGILSVDIDGNDYWVWQAINAVSPRIVVCEYNSQFGPYAEVTTPYDKNFVRTDAHFSRVYYGASISALTSLAKQKGYSLVAGNKAGNNVFFVRNDVVGDLAVKAPNEIYRRSCFREFHDEFGELTYDDFESRLKKLGDLPLYDVGSNQVATVRELVGESL